MAGQIAATEKYPASDGTIMSCNFCGSGDVFYEHCRRVRLKGQHTIAFFRFNRRHVFY
jgi:hypothetical protein